MQFTSRLNEVMNERNLDQVDLCRLVDGLTSSQANHLVTGRTKDPRLSTAAKIAEALDVSLDWLAGRSDDMEIKYKTAQARVLVDGFESLNVNGKAAIMEQLEFQQSRNSKSMPDTDVSEVA